MRWKKKEKETKPNKVKKVRTMKVGTHKKSVIALWLVLIASVSFGVYKNFTAIDMHTVHEKKIIEERIVDTNKIMFIAILPHHNLIFLIFSFP